MPFITALSLENLSSVNQSIPQCPLEAKIQNGHANLYFTGGQFVLLG
ncbi:hypothetical protein [Nitrosospira briensis]|nr:hypothetical protein [Nitrosospira briensis]